jgi:hypothetical protein
MDFEEKQSLGKTWVIIPALLFAIVLFSLAGYYVEIDPEKSASFLLGGIISGIVLAFIWIIHLKSEINATGIHYQFLPFHFKAHTIPWDEIQLAEVCSYKPLREFGGWGIKYGYNSKAFTISGNEGICITLKNKKIILIGTKESERAANAIKRYFKSKS